MKPDSAFEPTVDLLRWFWPRALRAYGFALFMGLLLVVPGCNSAFTGHGGPAIVLIPLGAAIAWIGLALIIAKSPSKQTAQVLLLSFASVVAYGLVTLLLSIAGVHLMIRGFPSFVNADSGDWLPLWALFFFPFTLLAPS